ncbi:hypothetical protein [Mycolicibacterium sp.]|uniref:hypothetical protein n=1 Tax=Mycolicibacterium sp. TaxID=2320850 RepID=UPI0037C83D92
MNPVLDTLIWLIDIPVRHGFVFVFLAVFGGLGALVIFLAAGREKGRPLPGSIIVSKLLTTTPAPLLTAARTREGLPRTTPPAPRRPSLARTASGALLVLLVLGGLLGLLGLVKVPLTHAYISAHGTETSATIDGEWVSFTAEDGTTYRVRNSFSAPATYPGSNPTIGYDHDTVPVRYLPSHPQAFIIVVDDARSY